MYKRPDMWCIWPNKSCYYPSWFWCVNIIVTVVWICLWNLRSVAVVWTRYKYCNFLLFSVIICYDYVHLQYILRHQNVLNVCLQIFMSSIYPTGTLYFCLGVHWQAGSCRLLTLIPCDVFVKIFREMLSFSSI